MNHDQSLHARAFFNSLLEAINPKLRKALYEVAEKRGAIMQLDVPTLFVLLIVIMAVNALLLLWAWLQNRDVKALAWWGVALLLEALGTVLIFRRGLIPDWLSIDLSNALLIFAYGHHV